jgi:uncharacterized protein YbjQ (UPF0145 family)
MSPWFKRRGGDQPGGPSREELAEQAAVAAQRSQDSLAEIEAGGLPLGAQERLKEIAAGGGAGVFSSDLSVQEYSLLTGLGVKPVTQVMGSSIYRVGWQPIVYNVPTEVTVLSGAFNECRRLALGRLAQEAQLAAADAVVGVRVERGSHDWAAGAIEFIAVGTAVRLPAAMRHPAGETVLTDLSGQQFVQLCRAGVRPVGIAGHTSVRYVPATWATQQALGGGLGGSSWLNQELGDFTQGVYEARELAVAAVVAQAARLGGDGLVGMQISQRARTYRVNRGMFEAEDLEVTFDVMGTVICEDPSLAAVPNSAPLGVLSLK